MTAPMTAHPAATTKTASRPAQAQAHRPDELRLGEIVDGTVLRASLDALGSPEDVGTGADAEARSKE